MTRLEFVEGSSSKFWEGAQDGQEVVVRWGRIGSDGQSKTHTFASPAAARAELEKLISSKVKKGYQRVGTAPAAPLAARGAREPRLEAEMFDAPRDEQAALVYADWLQSQGNPWGELITVQHALEKKPKDAALKKRETVLLKGLPLPDKQLATLTWRRGRIEALHLFNEKDWMDMSFDALAVANGVFDLPMCEGLQELRTGVLRWEANAEDVPAVLAAASKRPFARRLKRLFLGDVSRDIDMAHHVIGDLRKLDAWFPNLRWLKLHSGDQAWSSPRTFELGPWKFPLLETLIVETCAMSKKRLSALLKSALPALTTLELWFGDPDRDADAERKQLAPLLDGKVFPKVVHLGLRNAQFTNELCAVLPSSAIAKRVETLDLSMGVMDDGGTKSLAAAGAAAFPKLKKLDVSDSFLSDENVAALKRAFKGVELVAGEMKDIEPNDPEYRYCSVGE